MDLGKKKKWIIGAAAVLALLIIPRACGGPAKSAQSTVSYTVEKPQARDLVKTLGGNGMLKPANSYVVTTLIEGEVLEAAFEEGEMVEKDSVLYTIDSSNISNNIERAGISLSQARRNYSNASDLRNVKANSSGTIYSLSVREGDNVSAGSPVAVIRDSSYMLVKLPFQADDAAGFYEGQSADVSLPESFTSVTGTVIEVSGSETVGAGGGVFRSVTIEIPNPRALSPGQTASASIAGKYSAEAGKLSCRSESTVYAGVAGTVDRILIPEGSEVYKDQTIFTMSGKAIDDQIKSASETLRTAELSMDSTRDQLDNYTIKSPISGTIVDKQYKTGDTISAGKPLCTIYDLSYLEITLNIDELDIRFVKVGQKVSLTAEAAPGQSFTGEVTKVSVAGTSTGGTTTYPVTIRIDETEGLLPGMNADADITVAELSGVLSIPNAAVARGGLVLVTKDSPSAENAVAAEAPEGYVFVKVETGVSNEEYVEILSGLTADDDVAYIPQSSASDDLFTIMMNQSRGRS